MRQKRTAGRNLPKPGETIKAPSFEVWAETAHDNEYQALFLNYSDDDMTSLNHERVAMNINHDPILKKLRGAIQDGDDNEINDILRQMGNPRIGKGTTINSMDLSIYKDCIMVQNRFWIPAGLEQEVAAILHLGHKGVDNMMRVASTLC